MTEYESISEFLNNIPTKVVDEINSRVKEIATKPDDAAKFEFVCPECEHKDEVVLEVNPVNFFASGFITPTHQEITEKQKNTKKELDSLHKNLLKLTWYMRRGLITELHDMPAEHIKHINSIVEENTK